jgi:hypothetical protein
MQFMTRSLRISGYHSSPFGALSFSGDTNRIFFMRHVMNTARYLIVDRKYRMVAQTSFLVPVSKAVQIRYEGNIQRDAVLAQWINEILVARHYSPNFSLYGEVCGVSRFGSDDPGKALNLRASLVPEASFWFGRAWRLYAYLNLSPQLNHGFFSNFYLREGAGLSWRLHDGMQLDARYTYDAIGKRAGAFSTVTLGGHINF